MLGKRRSAWVLRLLVTDGLALLASFVVAHALRVALNEPLGRAAAPLGYYVWLLELILPVWLGLLAVLGAYGVRWTTSSQAWLVLRVSGIGLVLLTASLFLVKESEINRSLVALFALVSAVLLWVERGLVRAWLRRARASDRWARVALVVGTEERAKQVIVALGQYPEAGWVVRGCVSLEPESVGRTVADTPVIAALDALPDVLQGEEVVDEVFFAVPPQRLDEIADALEVCESLGVDTRLLVDLYRPVEARPFVEELFALPFYGFSPTLTRQGALAAKRMLDLAGAAILLVVGLPLLLILAVVVKATSRGPIIFRQERAGFHGRRFVMYKFRTMVKDAELMRDQVGHLNDRTGPVFKAAADPRLTRAGKVLRKFSLDELPQLVNVLKGDMSLVGPRPLPLYEARQIKGAQRRRLAMRPGITGLWQVSGRDAVDFEGWMQMDLHYVDRWSLGLDLAILLRTVPVVIRGEGAV
jgi:exopolysaccharide biosynthesis polyprenyl glycosylphosphotransferase